MSTLLLSCRSVVQENGLAQFSGFVPDGGGVTELPAAERAGFLTRMGWLGATSHAVFGSPVQRGVFVLERFMCVPSPAPPGDVDTDISDEELGPIVTNRDRYEQHSSDPSCFGCHQGIDGIGFGFENYDAIGSFQTLDNGVTVDATGEFVDGDLSGVTYDGALEMSVLLAGSETVHRCGTTQWYRYALGRSEQLGDQATLDQLADGYWGTGGELPQLLVDLVLTDSFRTRRAEGAPSSTDASCSRPSACPPAPCSCPAEASPRAPRPPSASSSSSRATARSTTTGRCARAVTPTTSTSTSI